MHGHAKLLQGPYDAVGGAQGIRFVLLHNVSHTIGRLLVPRQHAISITDCLFQGLVSRLAPIGLELHILVFGDITVVLLGWPFDWVRIRKLVEIQHVSFKVGHSE